MANAYKFRADQIGSLLRPPAVLEARRRVDAGMIDDDELREVENEAIAEAVSMQKRTHIDVITDGEFRRKDFRAGFVDAFEGIVSEVVQKPWKGPGGTVTLPSVQFTVTEKLKQRRRIAEGDVAYLKSLTKTPVKVTLIAPGFLVDRFWDDETTGTVYDSREEFAEEVVAATRREIEALIEDGASYVQLDNPGYAAFLDDDNRERMKAAGEDPDAAFDRMVAADAAAVADLERPETISLGLHVCRGNQSSLWLADGTYDPIAEKLFNTVDVDRFLLEYDDERAGGFEPLRFLPEGKMAVLGLVSTKSPRIETVDEILERMDEAAKVVDQDWLALSPQCGFASVALGGNEITPDVQERKLALVAEAAEAMYGFEI